MPDMNSPTLSLYTALEQAYDHFNVRLFGGHLQPCLITLRSATRVYGYHHAARFISPDGKLVDELGMHPGFFTLQPVEVVLSTLVHEMVHHWQNHSGTPSPSNPHNREWSEKMAFIGLQPSHTGLPGGKKTGRSMSDYVLPDGLFLKSCRELLAQGFSLPWMDRHAPIKPEAQAEHQRAISAAGVVNEMTPAPVTVIPTLVAGNPAVWSPPPKKPQTRYKFSCSKCETKAWAAPDAAILCGVCGARLTIQQPENQGH